MKKLDELAHLLANPVVPKASRHWSEADVVISSAPQPEHLMSSLSPRDREILTEHALEVSYFLEVLRDRFYEESLINHYSKIEFFGRLASAADACLLEQPDVTAHLVCAAVLREAYAMETVTLRIMLSLRCRLHRSPACCHRPEPPFFGHTFPHFNKAAE
jgi:hypothetical protein